MNPLVPDNIRLLLEQAEANPYVFGALPSEAKAKDFEMAPAAVPGDLPASYLMGAYGRHPIMNQFGGTCTGHACGAAMTYMQYEESKKIVLFDGEELHNRVVHEINPGAMPRDVLEEMRLHGAHSREGLYFVKAYGEVNWNETGMLRYSLSLNQPLILAIWLTKAFVDCWGLKDQRMLPAAPGQDHGYHAVVAVGYTPEGLIIQNSWSRHYGFNGTIGLTWEYLATHSGQAWTVSDQPDAEQGFVQHYRPVVGPVDGGAPSRVARRGGMPAVWAIYDGGRLWVQSKAHAAQMAVDLRKVEALPATDEVWSLPIIGKVPPGERNI